MKSTKTLLNLILLLMITFFTVLNLSSCKKNTEQLLLGKWKTESSSVTSKGVNHELKGIINEFEFLDDNKYINTYIIEADPEYNVAGAKNATYGKYNVINDSIFLHNANNKTMKYKLEILSDKKIVFLYGHEMHSEEIFKKVDN